MGALVAYLLGSLLLSAGGSLLEACLLGLSREEISRLWRRRPRAGRTLRFFKEELNGTVLAIRIFRILVHVVGAVLSGLQAHSLFGPNGLVPFALLYGLLLVLVSEILARALGTRHANSLAPWAALPLQPVLEVLTLAGRLRRRLAGRAPEPVRERRKAKVEESVLKEVSSLLRLASLNAWRGSDEAGIFSRAQDLSRMKVKDVMVERESIQFLSAGMSLSQALVEAHRHHHTRFPLLSDKDPAEVIGYVNFKDIVSALQLNPEDPSLAGICRPILTVEAEDTLASLLERMSREYQHIVLVRDRRGEVAGLVTLEDALEAVLGGANQKADRLPDYLYPIAENRHVAGGGVRVQTLRRELGLKLPDLDETLDVMLRQLSGGTPVAEQKIEVAGIRFIVRRMSGARIREVVIDSRKTA